MQRLRKRKVAEFNELLTCQLCKGYFIDATTIVECLHSFCRTCILLYLRTNKFCPTCKVQVHETNPLLNIRSDQTLQDIVYKIVPGLFKNEMKRRREFYQQQNVLDQKSTASKRRGDMWGCDRLIFTSEDIFSVTIEYFSLNEQVPANVPSSRSPVEVTNLLQSHTHYFNCPGAITVYHLKRLLRGKYGLVGSTKEVEILYMHDLLKDQFTLVDLAYIYSWKRSEPLRLFFKITQEPLKESAKELSEESLSTLPSSLPSPPPTSIFSSMAATPASRHLSPPPSPQMAQEPNDIAKRGEQDANVPTAAAHSPERSATPNPIGDSGEDFNRFPIVLLSKLDSSILAEKIAYSENSLDRKVASNNHNTGSTLKLKSALKKRNSCNYDFDGSCSVNVELTNRKVPKGQDSVHSRKRVSFSVNLVQDFADSKRCVPEYFNNQGYNFDPVKGSPVIRLKKKLLSKKSS